MSKPFSFFKSQAANITTGWTKIKTGKDSSLLAFYCTGMDSGGDTIDLQVRFEEGGAVHTIYQFTESGQRLANPAGNLAGDFIEFEIRAVLANAQAGTNAELIML